MPIRTRVAWLFKPRYAPKLRDIASHAALDPQEVVSVAPAFSKLKALIAAQPASFPEIEAESPDAQDGGDGQPREWKGRLATVKAVEPADAGRVLTRTNALLQTAMGVILIFGGLGLAFVPSIVIAHLPGQPPDWLVGAGVVAMMLMIALNLVWLVGSYPMYFTMRFMLWQTRRAFDARLNPAVDLNDPELVFVDIVPPINRGKHMMENASDIGFLKIDRSRRELMFEGDRERYWIPAESILEVKHEYWADSVKHQLQSAPNLNHDILVRDDGQRPVGNLVLPSTSSIPREDRQASPGRRARIASDDRRAGRRAQGRHVIPRAARRRPVSGKLWRDASWQVIMP